MIIQPTVPTGYVVFSDDVRTESNGKIITIGEYTGEMYVESEGPVIFPQLYVTFVYREDPNKLPKDITFVILQKGQREIELARVTCSFPSALLSDVDSQFATEGSKAYAQMRYVHVISPLEITESFRLYARAYYDDDEVRLGSLFVNLQILPSVSPSEERLNG